MLGPRILGKKAFAQQEAVRVIGADQLGHRVVGRPAVAAEPPKPPARKGKGKQPAAPVEPPFTAAELADDYVPANPANVADLVLAESQRDGGPRRSWLEAYLGVARESDPTLAAAIEDALVGLPA